MYNIPFITGDLLLEEDKVDVLIVSLVLCFVFVLSWIASEDFDWEIDDADMLLKLKDTWYFVWNTYQDQKKPHLLSVRLVN